MIKLFIQGRIIKGKYPDLDIVIEADRDDRLGHFILYKDPESHQVLFIEWVENFLALRQYFKDFKWQIDWNS